VDELKELKNRVRFLEEEQKRFADVIRRAPFAFQSLNSEGKFLVVNEKWLKELGYSRAEVIGRPFEEFLHPHSRPIFEKNFKIFRKKGTMHSMELRIRHREGKYLETLFEGCIASDAEGRMIQTYCVFSNLTELNTQRRKYEELVEKAGVAIVMDDLDGNIVYYNDMLTSMFGYAAEEIGGRPFWDLIHPEDREYARDMHTRRLAGEDVPARYEFRGIKKDGATLFLEVDVSIVMEDEKAAGTRSYFWDQTGRKRSEKKTRELEQQFRNILENSTNLFYSHTTDHQITFLSPQVEQILGYTVEEAMVKWTEFATDHPKNEVGFRLTMKAIETGERQPAYELQLRRRDGNEIWVEVNEFPLVEDGRTTSIIGSLNDITERKRAEEALLESEGKYRLIAENTGDNIAVTTFDSRAVYEYVSPSVEQVLGLKAEDLLGKSFFDFIHPQDKKKIFPLLKKYLTMKVKKILTGSESPISEKIEYRFRNKAGEWRNFQSTVTLADDKMISVTRDITEQKKAQDEIIRLKEGLEEEVEKKTVELKEKVNDLERFFNATIDRELRMEELHRENEELKAELKVLSGEKNDGQ